MHSNFCCFFQIFDLNLDLGPYNCAYSRNGRHLLLGGRKGHLALMDWEKASLEMEIQVRETINDVVYVRHFLLFYIDSSFTFVTQFSSQPYDDGGRSKGPRLHL
jgi:hypothetical protein